MDDNTVTYMFLHLISFAVTIYCASQLGSHVANIDIQTPSDVVCFVFMFCYPAFLVISTAKDYLSKKAAMNSKQDFL
jgi:hypothetical protein